MEYSVRLKSLVLLCCFLFLYGDSATLVDSGDDLEPQTSTTSENDVELNKLLLMKKLLSIRTRSQDLSNSAFTSQHASFDNKNLEAADLHTAYRLPLHRLSDSQLLILLQKYAENTEDSKLLSRLELISKLQELITKNSDKMLRPRLLTNINAINLSDLSLNQSLVQPIEMERTTVKIGTTTESYGATRLNMISNTDNLETTEQSLTASTEFYETTTEEPSSSKQFSTTGIETTAASTEFYETTTEEPSSSKQFSTTEIETTTEEPSKVSTESYETTRSSTLLDSENLETTDLTPQPHKKLPVEIASNIDGSEDIEHEMRQKNNRLHSQYIASLSEDLQRLKAKYDHMKLEFLRTLRRINERNIHRAQLANNIAKAAQTFVVPEKEKSIEPTNDSKNEVENLNKTTTIEPTQTETPELLETTDPIKPLNVSEEVDPSEFTNEPSDFSQTKDTTVLFETSTLKTPKMKILHQLEKLVESTPTPPAKGRLHSNGIYQTIFTVGLTKLNDKSPRVRLDPPTVVFPQKITTDASISMMEAVKTFESELTDPVMWKNQSKAKASILEPEQPRIHLKVKHVDELITAAELIDRLQLEAKQNSTLVSEQTTQQKCSTVTCDFEEGNLCRWRSSFDSLLNRKHLISNRRRRQARFITRAWQIRNGQFSTKNSTIDKSEWFSAINKHYVGTYLKPQQRSILSAHLPKSSAETITIKFKLWEAAKNLQLKVCCGNRKTCVFETEIGLKRGTRKWLSRQATCPGGTELVLFECTNHGNYQGICGIDSIELVGEECPTTKQQLLNGGKEH